MRARPKSSRRTSVARRCAAGSALLALAFSLGCARERVVLLAPDPCEPITEAQDADLELMILIGSHPHVEAYVSAYEQHCCEDDALAGRDTSICDEF